MQPGITTFEAHYLEKFPDIDPGKVGKQIGIGAQHAVREYGEDQVIKLPRLMTMRDAFSLVISRLLTPTVDRLRRDLDIAQEYFGDSVVPTSIYLDAKRRYYCMLQPRLSSFQPTVPDHVRGETLIREQLENIVESNRKLYAERCLYLDMMGWNPQNILTGQAALENVVIVADAEADKRLLLPDVTLFKPDLSLSGAYFRTVLEVQRLNMSRFGMKFV